MWTYYIIPTISLFNDDNNNEEATANEFFYYIFILAYEYTIANR